jgi:hypothetical protein
LALVVCGCGRSRGISCPQVRGGAASAGRETADLWLASLALALAVDADGAAAVFGRREAFDRT